MSTDLPRLIVRDASGSEREVEIHRTPFTLGRQSDNDLVLLDNRISRSHARIVQDAEGYRLEDTGSRHGTFVNGERVDSHILASGDQINLGVADTYQLFFVTEAAVIPKLLAEFRKVSESPAPQLQHLGMLLQMAQMLHRAAGLDEVLTALADTAIQLCDAERGLLFLRDDSGELRLRLARGRGGVFLPTAVSDYSRVVVERVAKTGHEEVILEDAVTGRSTGETGIIQMAVRGVVALPLQKLPVMESLGDTIIQTKPQLLGVIYLDSRARPTAVTGLDRQVLQTLAVEGATVIENARLFRMTREQERLRHELSLARNIQKSLLPRELPAGDFFELRAVTMSSQMVGGDYYDVIHLGDDRVGITVADVSGKGLPAAMTAANLQGAFAAVAAGDPELGELFHRINDFLCERTPSEMYATMFYGVLDRQGGFTFVNGGHTMPMVRHADGSVTTLDPSNFPLGFFPGTKYAVARVQLRVGDQVAVYSDGVTEATNAAHDLFGDERLKAVLQRCTGGRPQEVCDKVVAAVQEFAAGAPQADDLTLMVLRFGPVAN